MRVLQCRTGLGVVLRLLVLAFVITAVIGQFRRRRFGGQSWTSWSGTRDGRFSWSGWSPTSWSSWTRTRFRSQPFRPRRFGPFRPRFGTRQFGTRQFGTRQFGTRQFGTRQFGTQPFRPFQRGRVGDFVNCRVAANLRTDCGRPGISARDCRTEALARNLVCGFDSSESGVPFCFVCTRRF